MGMHTENSRLKTVLGEIEALRMKRQHELTNRSHPSLKRFTQQEMNDEAFPSYKNLLVGRSRRLPDRQTIINIAEYLECTSDERNDLLLAADYLPIQTELEGRVLERALEWAQQTMGPIPFPAMIVTHTQDIKEINEPFRRLFDIPRERSYDGLMNRVDFHFNPDLPIRSRSTFDKTSFEQWEVHAINGIQGFKREHILSRYDTWYQELLHRAQKYNADEYLNMPNAEEKVDYTQTILARRESSGELVPIRYRQVSISAGSRGYPQIVAFLPVDAAARKVFEELGCPAGCDFLNTHY
ncbi:hypothetical protein OIN60_13510 [Paenibacillus sp. P96]|uniref:MmyB-like transcription regulator ligand binding domain-containing protein n=1 Tax=Paenibacillus zeirhizosphaerae TaxID=2987519 RepID=A0ABT9FSR6_9BACL|nr:hypothetical protein [Paenibacillus sp. P96]MDP4097788.1 hypothetical protein [Paenibacillus sp. P96]